MFPIKGLWSIGFRELPEDVDFTPELWLLFIFFFAGGEENTCVEEVEVFPIWDLIFTIVFRNLLKGFVWRKTYFSKVFSPIKGVNSCFFEEK